MEVNDIIQSTIDWEEIFFRDVYNYASKSKDPRTKIGAVLVDWQSKHPISHGYNGFPRNVKDYNYRWERPTKYDFVVHAEENSILNCARMGIPTEGSVLFTNGVPCAACAKSICNAGIKMVIVHEPWQKYEAKFDWKKWTDSAELSKEMFEETKIKLAVYKKKLGIMAYLDGKKIKV